MRILGWDELSDDQRAQLALLDWSDWGSPGMVDLLHRPWQRGRTYQDYSSLVAVERGRPLARVGLIRTELKSRQGNETILGVSDVITDPSQLRRGLASRLVAEAHQRARSEGIETSFLGTRRSWGAHRGYEKLGYRDVFSPRLALRRVPKPPRPQRPRRLRVRRGRRSDFRIFQEILDTASADRIGFVPRARGSFEARLRLGWTKPNDYLVASAGGTPVGYAMAPSGPRVVTCREAVTVHPRWHAPLLDGIEQAAAGKILAFTTTTFLVDAASQFLRRGYFQLARSHMVLMACALTGSAAPELRRLRGLFEDPALFLHQPDTF